MRKAIFLDRDWTINKLFDKKYVCNPDKVELFEGVKNTLTKLKNLWYLLIIVTNQTWVWAWYYTKQQAEDVNRKIQELIWFNFDGIYSCYHHPDANCDCRKPKTWLFEQALKDFDIDIENSFMIWDKCKDIEAWKKMWLKTILFWSKENFCNADYSCDNWQDIMKIFEK